MVSIELLDRVVFGAPESRFPSRTDRLAPAGYTAPVISKHRLRFDLTNLVAVAVECAACGSSVAIPVAAITPPSSTIGAPRVPDACPRCAASWEQERERSPEGRFLADLALFLQGLADPNRTPPVNIRLDLAAAGSVAAREGNPSAERTTVEETQPETPSPESMPGLDLAYDFVQPSYQWLLSRFEAGNTRLQTMQAVIASVSLAVPAFARLLEQTLSFADARFVAAVVVSLAAIAIGVVGRQTGTVRLMHPKELCNWLTLPEAQFKYNALHWAGEHFDQNTAAVERKWCWVWAMLALFLIELVLLFSWALGV